MEKWNFEVVLVSRTLAVASRFILHYLVRYRYGTVCYSICDLKISNYRIADIIFYSSIMWTFWNINNFNCPWFKAGIRSRMTSCRIRIQSKSFPIHKLWIVVSTWYIFIARVCSRMAEEHYWRIEGILRSHRLIILLPRLQVCILIFLWGVPLSFKTLFILIDGVNSVPVWILFSASSYKFLIKLFHSTGTYH